MTRATVIDVSPRRAFAAVVRALALVLLLPMAASGSLPMWARVLTPSVHVCHCGVHHECLCVRCDPSRLDLLVSEESIKGQCGDEDDVAGAARMHALVAPAAAELLPASLEGELAPEPAHLHDRVADPPPTPPPRAARV